MAGHHAGQSHRPVSMNTDGGSNLKRKRDDVRMNKMTIMEQLKQADAEGYAIPHFNYSDIWDMTAIVRAAEELHSPVILAGVPKVTNALTMDTVAAMAHSLADQASVPVYLHLDHSTQPQICKDACDRQFSMVMIDGSKESLACNIALTKDVVSYAHPKGIFVEGEIGKIKGNTEESQYADGDFLVQVPDAVELVQSTGVDILAVGIGTAHGFYKGKPEINFQRLAEVNEALSLPLVLHGGTGIPEEDVRKAIKNGINKVNVGTIIKYTYLSSVFETLKQVGPTIHTIDLMLPAVEAIKQEVKRWIRVCMSEGRA